MRLSGRGPLHAPEPYEPRRTMRHTHRRHIEDRAKVQRKTRTPGMIATGRVDQHHLGWRRKVGEGGAERGTLAEREPSRVVARTGHT
jgi:hypothetical protein